jgi:hypothetical protein
MKRPAWLSRAALARLSAADWAYAAVCTVLALLVAAPWWRTRLLPMQDYPGFLGFVRTFQDLGNPSSPFFHTYKTAWPFSPLALPLFLTSALARLSSIEIAGKILLTLYALGLPVSAAFLLKSVGQSRWNVVWMFPLVFSKWVSSGFFAFFTGVPLMLLALALTVRFLKAPSARRGAWVGAVLGALVLWHALIAAEGLLGFGVLWLSWRAPSASARWKSLWPLAAPIVMFMLWLGEGLFRAKGPPAPPPTWPGAARLFDVNYFFTRVLMITPRAEVYAKLLVLAVLLGLVFGARARRYAEPGAPLADWHVKNPFAVLSAIALASYFVFPDMLLHVEIIGDRFVWFAAIYFGIAWNLPERAWRRAVAVSAVLGVAAAYLLMIGARFREFDAESIGASRLIDSIGERQTLIAPIGNGDTKAFGNNPLRDVQEYATVRKGGLPTVSFAGYGLNYVRYVHGNPMPDLVHNSWMASAGLSRFDYVLLRDPSANEDRFWRIRFLRSDGLWRLFAVRGSLAQPTRRHPR